MSAQKENSSRALEFWGGIESTVNRVNDRYFDQLHLNGHYNRDSDIKMIADLGIRTLRYPVLWEKHEPVYEQAIDWTYTENMIQKLEAFNITPIVGLLHHGSGPAYTNLADENFPRLFASYARKVAEKFPSFQLYTPINEPLTTARFSGLYGFWYPHTAGDVTFAKILLNEVKGIILAMQEVRKINPEAKLVQTEDLSKTYSSSNLRYQADFENERRWLTYDLLCGKVRPGHSMWNYFMRLGIKEDTLDFFMENATPPDIMGFNYYVTSERYLHDDFDKYPYLPRGGNEIHEYNDIEAIRINHGNPSGLRLLLEEAWDRYKLPIAITEAHLSCGREDQLRWLNHVINTCHNARNAGLDIRAVTFWSLFGAYGWNNLVTSDTMEYEPGAFDVSRGEPRATAIATFINTAVKGEAYNHPLLKQRGWWEEKNRFLETKTSGEPVKTFLPGRAVLITGKSGRLGQAFARICHQRNIKYILTGKETFDITNATNVHTFLDKYLPWAVINTAGFGSVDEAEDKVGDCFETNHTGPVSLAKACKERNISFLTFSCDMVFDGHKSGPYVETDAVNPINVYGTSKAFADRDIVKENEGALIIRTGSFFGPWDKENFVINLLQCLSENKMTQVMEDVFISPTYLPHLVHVVLDMLIDNECGVRHLVNDGTVSWKQFATIIAEKAGYDPGLIMGVNASELNGKADRPKNSALSSNRNSLLPTLEHAINCFFNECITQKNFVLRVS